MLIKEYTLPFPNDRSLNSIYDTQQDEVDNYKYNIEDLVNQCYIDTATWGLDFWEELLGISSVNSTIDQRRGAIKSALIGQGTVTVKVIEETAKAFTGGDVKVSENIEPFTFEVKFTGTKGVPPKFDTLQERINIIKPAHLLVKYTFTYNNWAFVGGFNWREISEDTWDQIRIR